MMLHRRWRPPAPLFWATLVLTLALSWIAAGDNTLPGDRQLLNVMHELESPVAESIDLVGYWIGSLPGIAGVAILLALAGVVTGRIAEGLLIFAAATFRILNPVLKWIIGSPRPTPDVVRVTEDATNYGFPSGHVMGVVLVYGCALYIAQVTVVNRRTRLAVQSFCILLILVTSFSRLYSGAHWPTDVLGGYLWGSLILMVLIGIYNRILSTRRRERLSQTASQVPASADRVR